MSFSTILAGAAATAFNLACTGTLTQGSLQGMKSETTATEAFATTYRINLETQRWCTGECDTTLPMAKVDETKLVFEYEDERNNAIAATDTIAFVNRENGEYFRRVRLILPTKILTTIWEGRCRAEKFTGMPTRQF